MAITTTQRDEEAPMKDYDGRKMIIRVTNRGKYQVLVADEPDMSTAPVFASREEAEAYINRPVPDWVATERARAAERAPYVEPYHAILARTDMREMRRNIQDRYDHACERSRLASAAQRAAVLGRGQITCAGRDVGEVRQVLADEYADEAELRWAEWRRARTDYQRAKHAAMRESGIPVTLFESPELF